MRKAPKTPGEHHARAMIDADILLDLIREELTAQAEADRQEGLHWGHVGSAQNYRELLRSALMQMRGGDDEDTTLIEIDAQVAGRRDGRGF